MDETIIEEETRRTDCDRTCAACARRRERTDEERRALNNRLSRIEGQVRGLRKMLDRSAYCVDIMVQVSAIKAALDAFDREIIGEHIRTCVADDIAAGHSEKAEELITVIGKLIGRA